MSYDNRIAELSSLADNILEQVVREGELMVSAQMTAASTADQRAMTFAGFLIAAATAGTGGVVALVLNDHPNWAVALIGASYAIAMLVASGLAIWSAKPGLFSFPGNEPASWHPEQWLVGLAGPHSIHQARVEQATTLQSQIGKNKASLADKALWMRWAVRIAFTATFLAAASVAVWGAHRRYDANQISTSASPPERSPIVICQVVPLAILAHTFAPTQVGQRVIRHRRHESKGAGQPAP